MSTAAAPNEKATRGTLVRLFDRLLARPRPVLAVLVVVEVGVTVLYAVAVQHHGWVWFPAGDQSTYSTTAWLLGTFHLPSANVGFGWPLVLAPITWVTGPTWLQAMPPIVALNVLVLGPLALLAVYGIAARIGGRLLGYWAALLWMLSPIAAIPLWTAGYRPVYVHQVLPQVLGLTALPDYPTMVALVVSAWLTLRAVDGRSWADGALASLVVGFAAMMRPSSFLFVVGAGLALLVTRRWREGAAFGAGLVPGLIALLIWKQRSLGEISLFHTSSAFAWGHWKLEMSNLREFFWSARLVQWAPVAGAIAVALRRRTAALIVLAGWLATFLLVRGTSPLASIEHGSFFRLVLPAWPAYVLLVATIPLLVPTLATRLGNRLDPPGVTGLRRAPVVVAAILIGLVPLLVVLTARQLTGPRRAVQQRDVLVPVDPSITVRTQRVGSSEIVFAKASHDWRAPVTYRLLRTRAEESDVECVDDGASRCSLTMGAVAEGSTPPLVDPLPKTGATYRVAVVAGPSEAAIAVSRPVRAQP